MLKSEPNKHGATIVYIGAEQDNRGFAPSFDVYHAIDSQNPGGTLTSGYRFKTQADADAAAPRVIEAWNKTGKFPNMCEAY